MSTIRDSKVLSFAYHGQAVGLAASLTKPCCEIIPSLATASLSITGGESYSTVRDYTWKGLISFDEASAYATGSKGRGHDENGKPCEVYDTLSTVTVKNLNVANMVHAGLIVARVTSKHMLGNPEPQVTYAGSMIEDLFIAGHKIPVNLDNPMFVTEKPTTFSALSDSLRKEIPKNVWANSDRTVVSASLVTKVGGKEGFIYPVPGFGTIYVAQVLLKPSYRRISMLRFELGCPIGGAMEAGGSETNGVEYWP